MMLIFCSLSHSMASAELASATGTEKSVPMLALTTFGLLMSVHWSQTITALTPAASAERNIVPRLPGFSMDSATTTRGASGI